MRSPEDRHSWGLAALIVALMVLGVTASLVAGIRLVDEAEQSWRERARREATRLTGVVELGLGQTEASLRSLGALFHSSDAVTASEFATAAEVASGRRMSLGYESFVFARHVPHGTDATRETAAAHARGSAHRFAVKQRTSDGGFLAPGDDLDAHPAVASAARAAFRSLEQVVMSSAFVVDGSPWAAVAFTVPNGAEHGVLLGLLDLQPFLEDLRLQTPEGLHLRLAQREPRGSGPARLRPLLGPAEAPADAVETMHLQLINGQAHWLLSWDLTPRYAGGPPTTLGYAVALGGCAMTLLISALFAVLSLQNARIRTRVRERTQELARARDDAERANRAKTDFLANMSHELRTPLNAVIGFAEVIRDEVIGPLGQPKYREYARDIHESGTHLLSLINDILDVAKAEAGTLRLEEAPVDLSETVRACVRLLRERAETGAVRIDVELPANCPYVIADPRRVKQVVLNLLSNAVKFTEPDGRVTMSAGLAPDGAFEIVVEDTGIGMSEDEVRTALAPFSQVDSAVNRKFEGTGLGLPLTQRLLQEHGGRLEIFSCKGVGTRAVARFPADRVEARRDAA